MANLHIRNYIPLDIFTQQNKPNAVKDLHAYVILSLDNSTQKYYYLCKIFSKREI